MKFHIIGETSKYYSAFIIGSLPLPTESIIRSSVDVKGFDFYKSCSGNSEAISRVEDQCGVYAGTRT